MRRGRKLRDGLKLALFAARFQHTSAYVSIRQHPSDIVSIHASGGDGVQRGVLAQRCELRYLITTKLLVYAAWSY